MRNNNRRARTDIVPSHIRRHRAIVMQICLFLLIASFGALAVLVRRADYLPVDLAITRYLQSLDTFMSAAMNTVSWVGYSPQAFIIAGVTAFSVYMLGLRWEAVTIAAGDLFEELLNLLVKTIIHRPRPSAGLVHVLKEYSSYSFPSGHVMFYTVFFGFLWFLVYMLMKHTWKRTLLLAVFSCPVLLIGISRIYLGEHWASDALGAYLLGTLALIAVITFYRWGKDRFFIHQPKAESGK